MQVDNTARFHAYLETPAGCDGGNIAGSNWLFGVESGGAPSPEVLHALETDGEHGCVAEDEIVRFVESCPYNRNLAKFEAAHHGWPVSAYREFAHEFRLFARKSEFYKGNVGAFSFPHDNAESFEPYKELFGVPSKQALKQIEIDVRAAMFQEWIRAYCPSCVICFGTGDRARFLRAFSDGPEDPGGWGRLYGLRYYHSVVNSGRTSLFILPHLTAPFHQGLTSDYRLKSFGDHVTAIMMDDGFEIDGKGRRPRRSRV